ncbi:MAG TPA: hypothetical protein VKB50_29550 [Vicinamibacterales bacterium]|nr:hypothetical protein [Vicinamibacterales bacterium]
MRRTDIRIPVTLLMMVWFACGGLVVAQAQPPQDRINSALARARQAGVPVSLLEGKVAEGKAKGYPLERIAVAIERREGVLEHASQVMKGQPGTGDAELSVAADALESGVTDNVLRAVSELAQRDRRAVAIVALTQLVQLGHSPGAALARVQEALKRGPEALLNLPAEAGPGRGPGRDVPPGTGNSGESSGGSGRGNNSSGPPTSVPAPGQATQPTKPNKARVTPPGR